MRWNPVAPLDQRWLEGLEPQTTALRERWHARRKELEAAGTLDETIARLLDDWGVAGYLPRPVETQDRSALEMLLEIGFDGAVGASFATDPTRPDAFPTVAARAQAAELLLAPIREQRDLLVADIARLHALLCPRPASRPAPGTTDLGAAAKGRGRFRADPAFVMGVDNLFKEGCPPERLTQEVAALARTTGDARRAGILGPVRGAWNLFALSVVHPFYDGNGRVARMLASFALVRDGEFPFLMPPQHYPTYLKAFSQARRGDPRLLVRLVARCQCAVLESALKSI